jgi:TonB-dependent SusC/RagA subfamily outer membrane receptor
LGDAPVARAEELLQGKFPGVVITRLPNGGLAVRIRGTNSLLGSNEPLYVVDGMTIEPGPGGALFGINPGDIEKITVLKDVGSTGLYGVRGANGVVVITTKR